MKEFNTEKIFNYWKGASSDEKIAFRAKVLDMTKMAYSSFYAKINGTSEFTPAEIYLIESLIIDSGD